MLLWRKKLTNRNLKRKNDKERINYLFENYFLKFIIYFCLKSLLKQEWILSKKLGASVGLGMINKVEILDVGVESPIFLAEHFTPILK
jgi:hypothetical protein